MSRGQIIWHLNLCTFRVRHRLTLNPFVLASLLHPSVSFSMQQMCRQIEQRGLFFLFFCNFFISLFVLFVRLVLFLSLPFFFSSFKRKRRKSSEQYYEGTIDRWARSNSRIVFFSLHHHFLFEIWSKWRSGSNRNVIFVFFFFVLGRFLWSYDAANSISRCRNLYSNRWNDGKWILIKKRDKRKKNEKKTLLLFLETTRWGRIIFTIVIIIVIIIIGHFELPIIVDNSWLLFQVETKRRRRKSTRQQRRYYAQ